MKLSFEIETASKKQNIDIDFPNSWDEVSPSNWLAILKFRQSCVVETLPKNEWKNPLQSESKIYCNNYLGAFDAIAMLNKLADEYLYPELVDFLLIHLEWIKELPNHYQSLKPWVSIWKGPKDKLIDWKWDRYCFAEQEFKSYVDALESGDLASVDVAVNRLFSIVYSPFGVWNIRLVPLLIFLSKFIRREKKTIAIGNYNGIRNWLQELYSLAFKSSESQEVDDSGLRKLTIAMAGDKFGKVSEVFSAKMHDVLIYQCSLIEQSNLLKS